MFEKIVIRRHDSTQIIDPGALAETLIFYGNVHLLLDAASLTAILQRLGVNNLLKLLNEKRITATILTDILGTNTNTPLVGQPIHSFAAFKIARHADGRRYKRKDIVLDAFERALPDKKTARAKAERFLQHVSFKEQGEVDPGGPSTLVQQATNDLNDPDYLRYAVQESLLSLVPSFRFPERWYFRARLRNNGEFTLETNLDFAAINSLPGSGNSISPASLAGSILEARADLALAANYMSEIVTDPARSKTLQRRFAQFLERRMASAESIETFQEVHLSNARAIREAINSGERSFDEFLKILEKAEKFKGWLSDLNPDARLLDEYYDAATRETWANSLPTKSTRFAVCTIAGFILEALHPGMGGQAMGVSFGAADMLWIDKILKGWRPSHFVSGPLKRFVGEP